MRNFELTESEKKEIEGLRAGFNRVKLSKDEDYLASKRIEVSKPWIKRLLQISFILNIGSIMLVLMSIVFILMKPAPSYYASTPSGKVIPLQILKK